MPSVVLNVGGILNVQGGAQESSGHPRWLIGRNDRPHGGLHDTVHQAFDAGDAGEVAEGPAVAGFVENRLDPNR